MSFEPIFETINCTLGKKILKEQIKTDCRSEVNSEEISNILNVSAFATVSKTQQDLGKFEYGGKVVFYVSYVGVDGKPHKCECGSEFKNVVKDECVRLDSKISVSVVVDKCYSERSGARLSVGAYLSIKAEVSSCEQVRALSGGENLVVSESEVNYLKSYGVKSVIYPIEEEVQLGYSVSEVLSHRAQAVITSVQCGVGCIIVDGEALLSAIMLQNDDRNGIIKESKTIPFRVEIECEEAMPNMQATAKVIEKSFKTDVTVDQEGGISVATFTVNLECEGEVFYNQPLTLATDAFSTEQELELIKKDLHIIRASEVKNCSAVISGRAVTDELPVGATVLAVGGEKIEVVSLSCVDNLTKINGALSAVMYVRDGEGKTFTVGLETPFECMLDCFYPCDASLEVVAKAKNARARIVSLSETELETEAHFSVYPEVIDVLPIIDEIKPLKEKEKNDSALSVYIATSGEDMWSLAKRLNVCPEALAQTNSDLQFPLSGKERIVIYRQK